MALFTPKEDLLIEAMTRMDGQIQLNNCIASADSLIKLALNKEPRLLAFLSGYEGSSQVSGLSKSYTITLKYQDDCPASINDVLVDTGSWDAKTVMGKGGPIDQTIITEDPGKIQTKLTAQLPLLVETYEGLYGGSTTSYSFGKISTKYAAKVSFDYLLPVPELRQLQGKAAFAAKNIWRRILGRARVPQFVKPFLAFSFITQECSYDQRCYDELNDRPQQSPSDPVPHLAYGPLVEGRGICSGLAWAFKRLMDEANIECICVSGYTKEDTSQGHMWNLVKLDNQYYHVDPTWGIKNPGVNINGLMQPDTIMRATHIWEESRFPSARGSRFGYDYVEDFLAENGSEYLDDGANETYFFPDEIVE